MAKATKFDGKITSPLFLLFAIILVGLIYNFNSDPFQDIRGRAEEDPNFCQNHCRPNSKSCDFSDTTRTDDPNLNDPCCEEIKKTGDPGACPWPQRGYCTDDQCAAIPEGVSKERCGGPRHSWCGECQSHNCPGYGSNPVQPTKAPVSTVASPTQVIPPTSAPIPTDVTIPTEVPPTNPPLPTQIPEESVKPRPQITYVPIIVPPYTPSTLTPTPTPFKFNLPNILPPKEKVQSFWEGIRLNLVNFFSKILP